MSCERWKLVVMVLGQPAGEHPDAAGRPPGRVAERRGRDETSRVDGKNRHVRAQRRIRRRPQLRLVVGAVQPQTAGEVDQRLLIRQAAEHRHRRLQRRQLTIRIQDVELGIVLPERRADVGGRVGNAVAVLVVAEHHPGDHVAQLLPVVGEILLHAHRAAFEAHDGQKIGRLHLLLDELQRRGVRARQVRRRQRRHVEVEHDEPAIAVLDVSGSGNGNASLGDRRRWRGGRSRRGIGHRRGRRRRGGGRRIFEALKFDEAHRLRLAVLGDDEIARSQSFDGFPVLVLDADRLDDESRAAPKCRLLSRDWCDQHQSRTPRSRQTLAPRRTQRTRRVCCFKISHHCPPSFENVAPCPSCPLW